MGRYIGTTALLCGIVCALSGGRATAKNPTCEFKDTCAEAWEFMGPLGYHSPDALLAAGAVQAVTQTGTGFVAGSVNGGLWFTESSSELSWKSVSTPNLNCLSIAALGVSQSNKNVVYAGCGGSTSSEQGVDWNVLNTGDYGGLMVSENGGRSWEMENFPVNWYITAALPLSTSSLLVSARAYFNSSNEGGIWMRSGARTADWQQVVSDPVYNMASFFDSMVVAVKPMDVNTAVFSGDGGKTWEDWSGFNWHGYTPFYPCIAVAEESTDSAIVFVGALTVNTTEPTDTASAIFWRRVTKSANGSVLATTWTELQNQPQELDDDAMPKDRMALLLDPRNHSILYVAGNGGAVTWRVDWQENKWTSLIGNDTADNSAPHVDCRNFAWDSTSNELLLVSDGGVFARSKPEAPGGKWRTLNTGIAEMEFLSAHYDHINDRWVAGAQDNDVQVSAAQHSVSPSQGIVLGDGTVTAVDYTNGRLFGSRQFAGSGDVDQVTSSPGHDGDDDDDFGLAFVDGASSSEVIPVPLDKLGFKDSKAFPFFVHPWVLNSANQTELVFWARGVGSTTSGWYSLSIPANLTKQSEFTPPRALARSGGDVYMFVAGGVADGVMDPSLLVGMNGTHLYLYSDKTSLVTKALPTKYAAPITWTYNAQDVGIVGPVSHGKTVSIAVHPKDSKTIAVTGWPSVLHNNGTESIYVSFDSGDSWTNVIAELREVSGTVGMVRPAGLIFIPLKNGKTFLLVGTTRGVYGTQIGNGVAPKWVRVGGCETFPTVLTPGLSHNPFSDTLVAATMGRGVYAMHGVTEHLQKCH